MADMSLELLGEHFRRQYLLYIIEISHGDDKYFYVGQTGDNRYTTARPAFRRLAGHFEDGGQSTQNQIYRYIAADVLKIEEARNKQSAFTSQTKQAVEYYLVNSVVKMHAYSLEPFSSKATHEKHLQKVRKVTLLEKQVIAAFLQHNRRLVNKKLVILPTGDSCPYPQALEQIKQDFSLST
ncbi:MAG: hypothetical protein DDT33_00347 [Firmicutes bacterium]|nr:hypothetical protein [Bacillota bacterium]